METRIVASAAKMKQLQSTAKKALDRGDLGTARKAQGLIGILNGTTQAEIATILDVTTETLRLWLGQFMLKG